jgi:hypothetical protein
LGAEGGVNLSAHIYDSSGEGDFSGAGLKEIGHTRAEIERVRLSATDDLARSSQLGAAEDLALLDALPQDDVNLAHAVTPARNALASRLESWRGGLGRGGRFC